MYHEENFRFLLSGVQHTERDRGVYDEWRISLLPLYKAQDGHSFVVSYLSMDNLYTLTYDYM